MTEFGEQAVYVVAGIAGVWLAISLSGALPIMMLARVDLRPLPQEEAAQWLHAVLASRFANSQWLADEGFEPLGVYTLPKQLGEPRLVVWQRSGERTYFVVYVMFGNPHNAEFVTCFDEGGMNTGTTKDALLAPPRPGHWMQAFKVADTLEQWNHHAAALEFLRKALGKFPSTQRIDFREEFVGAVREHAAYLRSLPIWFLRTPYWYVARRYGLFNKTVQEQFDR